MKRAGIVIGIILILGAYVFGYWPAHEAEQETRQQLKMVSDRLNDAQAKLGLCRLQIHLLAVVRQTEQKNYGNASSLSTSFFNEVSRQASATTDPDVQATLQSILKARDGVTASLAKADPDSMNLLQPLEDTLFTLVDQTLGGSHSAPAGKS